ncbi:hypothetical protein NY2A_b675R [Paramecium bursaria Chlorella virus NY2A]|uniref:Uncharacterized protein b675R n=1 Tax=Paramecium bursaria Chlorella virus NY2A TaxID=46021 RepID=A7IXK0_PBCVN|nr:hypothetical protein NY2A_b675R [Paramecium bursaria Chlorella virus NY2A]ABT15074.1 hypothetical protein NY2A_b675R [Paramecium bursaria Chlorella virus NY2A]
MTCPTRCRIISILLIALSSIFLSNALKYPKEIIEESEDLLTAIVLNPLASVPRRANSFEIRLRFRTNSPSVVFTVGIVILSTYMSLANLFLSFSSRHILFGGFLLAFRRSDLRCSPPAVRSISLEMSTTPKSEGSTLFLDNLSSSMRESINIFSRSSSS